MTFRDLSDFQDLMFRNYLRSVMFFATLPYYLTHEIRRNHRCEGGSRPPRNHRVRDLRWLR
jgi:hypothetical protein